MKKEIRDTKIYFLTEDTNEVVMYLDYSSDECIWYFSNDKEVLITSDMELFEPINQIMIQQYIFSDNEVLKNYKDANKLIWYSDCYCNYDDEWSRNSVSYLTIESIDGSYKLKCTKPLDKIMNRKDKSHVITFSPLGNGKYTKNVKTGLSLQDEFVINVYQKLLQKEKVKELYKQ